MNTGIIKNLIAIEKEKKQRHKQKELSELLSDLILMGEDKKNYDRNINIYTCAETKMFNKYLRTEQMNIQECQLKAYYIAKRYIQIKDQYKGPGIQAGP